MQHRTNLDSLRALAVCCVCTHHFLLTLQWHVGLPRIGVLDYARALGHAGVLIFFVHTCLVLMYSLERMHRAGGHVTMAFYIRRLFRIYPLAFVAIAVAVAFHFPSKTWGDPDPRTAKVILANLFLVQNLVVKKQVLGPLWSLPYEIQMYVVLPVLYWVAQRRQAPLKIGALFACFCTAGVVVAERTGHLNMWAYVPCFLCGVLCYSLRFSVPPRIPSFLWMPFLVGIIAFFVSRVTFGEEPTYWSGWVLCLVLGLGLNVFRDSRSKTWNALTHRVAVYSYGVYLLHQPVLSVVFDRMGVRSVPLAVLFFVALTAGAAAAAFHLVESPCMDLGRRLSNFELRRAVRDSAELQPAP